MTPHALWNALWPNIFAPNIWTLVALVIHLAVTLIQRARQHHESERRADERHQDLKRHVTCAARDSESEEG